ncbi:hypothetical protein RHGRI_032992 [Rhododendron griersonianum]|uniref:Hexosyltransferase n=1 Tax=Rhododendron griersonianum TaxID=479676 RepID=A0AAV6IE43_9ERIC|nr:hypothetical protein RHGRI_032992 [Rhododendron griersonianum]
MENWLGKQCGADSDPWVAEEGRNLKVLYVIGGYTRSWKRNIVHELFREDDAGGILAINSIASRDLVGRLVWHYTPNVMY